MKTFQIELSNKLPGVTGSLSLTELSNVVTIKGVLTSPVSKEDTIEAVRDVASAMYPQMMLSLDVRVNDGLTVLSQAGSSTMVDSENPLDEINVLYQGMLDISAIKSNDKHKLLNENTRPVMDNIYRVLEFTAPIVLDSNLMVIDGNLRLDIAKENGASQVPVIVIDTADERSEFLRLALNRSSEFQRWNYEEVDNFVDSIPQVQPLLEPLGFFGQKVLPESFFANTVIQYFIDPFNEQQKAYQQDEGLAEYARRRREEMKAAEAKLKEQKAKKKPKMGAVSLFDLAPKKDDFLETYDIDEEVHKHVEHMKDVAGKITDSYDEKRKAEMEAKGQSWQGSRRSSKQVAADRRSEFMGQIDEHTELTEDQKKSIIDQLEDIETSDELELLIEGVKSNE